MIKTNLIYNGYGDRSALYDILIPTNPIEEIFVFVHGYMGYKDWGVWNLMSEYLYNKGCAVAKLNLTTNGTTLDKPKEFADLDRFGNGGYFQELKDVQCFLNHLEEKHDFSKFRLIGHSRGGGIVLLAGLDERVRDIHCLAPISSIENRFPTGEDLKSWKKNGVYYRKNGRTNQEMPHYYAQYEEFLAHQNDLNIENACKRLNKPVYVFHGENDTSVLPQEGKLVAEWSNGKFHLIENTAHTFDAVEPWKDDQLPVKMKEVLEQV